MMAYQLSFDGLKRDVAELAAWMLSFEGRDHLKETEKLKALLVQVHPEQVSSRLLSIAAQVRVVSDSTKNIGADSKNRECGTVYSNVIYNVDGYSSELGKPIKFREAVDKILHATIEVERLLTIGAEERKIIIKLVGKERRGGKKWLVELDVVLFCEVALRFIEDAISKEKP